MTSTSTIVTKLGQFDGTAAVIYRKKVVETYEALDNQGNWVEVYPQELLTELFKIKVEGK